MKRMFAIVSMALSAFFIAWAGPGTAQSPRPHVQYFDENGNPIENHDDHDGHEGHDHEGHDHAEGDHDHSEESVRALFEGVAGVVYGEPENMVMHKFVGVAPRFGLAVQKSLFFEAGVSLDIYRIGYTEASEYVTFGYRNLRPYLSGEIMASGKKLLGGGKVGAEFIMSTALVGMAFGADASYYTDGKKDAIALTPRLMLSFVYVEVFYGYNIFIRNHLKSWIGPHRFGVSMTLNTRYWKRKKSIYNDYYISYAE